MEEAVVAGRGIAYLFTVEEEFIMLQSLNASTEQNRRGLSAAPTSRHAQSPSVREEILPFTVRLVRSEGDVRKAVQVRHSAYARHVPAMAEKLINPEPTDYEDGVAVLLAESKLDGSPLGTMRIQTNRFKNLSIEQSIELPPHLKGRPLAEATRLGVELGRTGTFVKTVLFKAFFRYCVESGIEWMVIAARSPLDRQYDQLMFTDIFPGTGFIPMRHGGNIPHRALCFEVATAEARWQAAGHPMLDFMTRTRHPDIDVAPAATTRKPGLVAEEPRRSDGRSAFTTSHREFALRT